MAVALRLAEGTTPAIALRKPATVLRKPAIFIRCAIVLRKPDGISSTDGARWYQARGSSRVKSRCAVRPAARCALSMHGRRAASSRRAFNPDVDTPRRDAIRAL
eukprot:676930-Rhodomonas_salina.1